MSEPRSSHYDEVDEESAWKTFKASGSEADRQRLFTLYSDFAQQIASRHRASRRTADVDFGDLSQFAMLGLLEAIDRFDPNRGVPFKGFAVRRIAGSIRTGLAKMSEARQNFAFRQKREAERLRALLDATGGEAGGEDAYRILSDLAGALAIGFMLDASKEAAHLEAIADTRPSAYDSVAWSSLVRRIRGAVDRLSDREKVVIDGHYLQGLTFEDVAEQLGLTKGRVSQIHRSALDSLRRKISKSDQLWLQG